ncbi:MAG: AraC family transcriptional regulator [Lachnospiraceae bacterium]|nr:AraC family transcriptional regulator [Lachnospiraceae bacterium]
MRTIINNDEGGNLIGGEPIQENEYLDMILEKSEHDILQQDYTDEVEIMDFIRNGDLDGFNIRLSEYDAADIDKKIGEMAHTTYKKYEYLASGTIALATRAAIEGGIDFDSAHALGKLYLQRLEKCTSIKDILKIQVGMFKSFINLVHQHKTTNSECSYIEKTKAFIFKNLNKPFTLEDVAKEIHLNPSYLSRQFSSIVGIGIKKYTQIKRIEAASNMLKYSDEEISKISNYLQFPSQSRFGVVFKNHFGITPHKYREKNK